MSDNRLESSPAPGRHRLGGAILTLAGLVLLCSLLPETDPESLMMISGVLLILAVYTLLYQSRKYHDQITAWLQDEIGQRHKAEDDLLVTIAVLKQQKVAALKVADEAEAARCEANQALLDLKMAQTELREALEFQDLIMNNIPDLIFVTDPEAGVVHANTAFRSLIPGELLQRHAAGYNPGAQDNYTLRDFIHDDQKAVENGFSEAEDSLHFPNGGKRIMFTKRVRFKNTDGKFFILCVSRDITALKESMALKRSEEVFRTAMEQSSIGMALLHPDGRWLKVNRALCEIVGYTEEDLLNTGFQQVTHRDDLKVQLDIMERMLAGEKSTCEIEKRFIHKDGRHVWVLLNMSVVWNEDGTPRYFVSQIQDITERKEALDKLRKTNTELEQFAYVASHDLQEPLRMVTNYTQLLASRYGDLLDEDGHDFINFAVEGSKRMQKLIMDLLQYSRLGTRAADFEDTNANDLFDHAIENLTVAIDEAGTVVTRDDLPVLHGDVTQLQQVFQNLISNAVKYRDPEKLNKVHVSADMVNGEYVFCVEDNGIGIKREYYDRIFMIFKRLHTSQEYPGTGIGLTLCKRIVDRHGGRIWVESNTDRGSRFYFSLPATARMAA